MRPPLKDFAYRKLKYKKALKIIPNLKRLIEEFRRSGLPVVYVNDSHLPVDPFLKKYEDDEVCRQGA
ncbi:MAG: isochorismatase family protein [Thaumarchaeota archaeon]|jgi:nicotinamidase-related amidase|nr:isochorismatase family protein [Nitrososphaerota archaeon]